MAPLFEKSNEEKYHDQLMKDYVYVGKRGYGGLEKRVTPEEMSSHKGIKDIRLGSKSKKKKSSRRRVAAKSE